MKEFLGLWKVKCRAGCIDKPELGKLPKERHVVFQMTNEVGECHRTFMDVGKRHHRRGRNEEHRKLIHEVPDGRAGGLMTEVKPGRKVVLLEFQSTTEEGHFFGLGFEDLMTMV